MDAGDDGAPATGQGAQRVHEVEGGGRVEPRGWLQRWKGGGEVFALRLKAYSAGLLQSSTGNGLPTPRLRR